MMKRILELIFAVCTLTLLPLGFLSAQTEPDTGTGAKASALVFAINLDQKVRSIQVGQNPALYQAMALKPAQASALGSLGSTQALRLYAGDSSTDSLAVQRSPDGRFYEYSLAPGRIYALVLLPQDGISVVALSDAPSDKTGARIFLANANSQGVKEMQVASEFGTNVLVYLPELPPLQISNPAWISWPAKYGWFYADKAAEGGFRQAKDSSLAELKDGTWWVGVAGPDGITVSQIK